MTTTTTTHTAHTAHTARTARSAWNWAYRAVRVHAGLMNRVADAAYALHTADKTSWAWAESRLEYARDVERINRPEGVNEDGSPVDQARRCLVARDRLGEWITRPNRPTLSPANQGMETAREKYSAVDRAVFMVEPGKKFLENKAYQILR